MLSLIVYGRNDSYGYNLHKRAALSLNCMAEVLSDSDDEILFVDYNTPDDFPTFPEAIKDTLTDNAIRRLRILRVRPTIHARFARRTRLVALEPIARNVAVRRSNPANRWILSTNTDMIFVPRCDQSLSDIVRDLPRGYFATPRFELPETLWETFDRRDPNAIVAALDRWGWQFHLNEIVYGLPFCRFDGPGDFQLIERADLFAINSFHEGMLHGWHVDANIAKRMSLVYPAVGDLSDQVFAYHCDHTRQVTHAHRRDAVTNDVVSFVNTVDRPDIPEQATTWGCVDDQIEEIRLDCSSGAAYIEALETVLLEPLAQPIETAYTFETYEQCGYVAEHILPYLLDLFATVPKLWSIGWIGARGHMFDLFCEGIRHLGFNNPIRFTGFVAHTHGSFKNVIVSEWGQVIQKADVVVIDFSKGDGTPLSLNSATSIDNVLESFYMFVLYNFVRSELDRIAVGLPPRRLIAINGIHNHFETVVSKLLNIARTPFNLHMRHGFLDLHQTAADEPIIEDWTEGMKVGSAGARDDLGIVSKPGISGLVAFGVYVRPKFGGYEIVLTLSPSKLSVDLSVDRLFRAFRTVSRQPSVIRKWAPRAFRKINQLLEVALERGWRAILRMEYQTRVFWTSVRQKHTPVKQEVPSVKQEVIPNQLENEFIALSVEVAFQGDILAKQHIRSMDYRPISAQLSFNIPPPFNLSETDDQIEIRIYGEGGGAIRLTRVTCLRRYLCKNANQGLSDQAVSIRIRA